MVLKVETSKTEADGGAAQPTKEDTLAKKKHLDKALAFASRCLELFPDRFHSHKWMAVILSAQSESMPIKEKIEAAFKVKDHADVAVRLLNSSQPSSSSSSSSSSSGRVEIVDGTLEHIIGRWCVRIAGISWIERKLASVVITAVPDARSFSLPFSHEELNQSLIN